MFSYTPTIFGLGISNEGSTSDKCLCIIVLVIRDSKWPITYLLAVPIRA